MISNKKIARIAGWLYVIAILTGIFTLRYVPSKIIAWQDPKLNFENIIQHESLFRLGIVAEIIGYTAFFLLPIVLYGLLSPIHRGTAIAIVSLGTLSIPFSLGNMMYKVNILTLIHSDGSATSTSSGLQTEVLRDLHFYDNGVQIASVFWGLWLLPFGYLVWRSGFLPKVIGIILMLGCFGYLANFIGSFLFPGYRELGVSKFVTLPASIGELAICLWLVTVGVKAKSKPPR